MTQCTHTRKLTCLHPEFNASSVPSASERTSPIREAQRGNFLRVCGGELGRLGQSVREPSRSRATREDEFARVDAVPLSRASRCVGVALRESGELGYSGLTAESRAMNLLAPASSRRRVVSEVRLRRCHNTREVRAADALCGNRERGSSPREDICSVYLLRWFTFTSRWD